MLKKQLIFIGLMLVPFLLFAQSNLEAHLILDHIKLIKSGESAGDELYFDISAYQNNNTLTYTRIPKSPMHWSSEIVKNISNLTLWSQSLSSGEAVTLLVSLNDEDAAPWNPNDLIGLIRVRVKNEAGHLKINWSLPNQNTTFVAEPVSAIQKFDLSDSNGHYEVYLRVQSSIASEVKQDLSNRQ